MKRHKNLASGIRVVWRTDVLHTVVTNMMRDRFSQFCEQPLRE